MEHKAVSAWSMVMAKRRDWEKANKRPYGAGTAGEEINTTPRVLVSKKGKQKHLHADELCERDPKYKHVTVVIKREGK